VGLAIAGADVVARAGTTVVVGGVVVGVVAIDLVASAGGRGGGMAADDETVLEVARGGAVVAVATAAAAAAAAGVAVVDLGEVAAFLDLPPPVLGLRRMAYFLGVGVAKEVATNPTSTWRFRNAATYYTGS
jgi:hypothetical protein